MGRKEGMEPQENMEETYISLSERSQCGQDIYYMIPTTWCSEKAKS